MSKSQPVPLVINGWTVFTHPLFLAQLEAITRQVEGLKQKDPVGYVKKNASKRLAAITKFRVHDLGGSLFGTSNQRVDHFRAGLGMA